LELWVRPATQRTLRRRRHAARLPRERESSKPDLTELTVGIARATAKLGLANVAYNLLRFT
jgi:hypothetical protein